MMIKKSIQNGLLVVAFLFAVDTSVTGQQKYTGVFAPTENLVKPSEQPYRESLCLNGSWQFQPVALPAGFKEGVDKAPVLGPPSDTWEKVLVKVPSPWNVNGFANHNGQGGDFRTFPSYPKYWENIKMGWLKKAFNVPANWTGKRIIIHFDGLAGDAEIKVNGKDAGRHFGIFLPFDIDVTDLIDFGKSNELCIGIRKPSLFDKEGLNGRRSYQAGSFWGQHIIGIWQDVFIEALPVVRMTNVYVQSDVAAGKLEADILVKNDRDKDVTVTLGGNVFKWLPHKSQRIDDLSVPSSAFDSNPTLNIPDQTVNIPAHGESKLKISIDVKKRLQEWSPDSPNLYVLLLKSSLDGKPVDCKYTRFGWRQITFDSNKVLLNGKSVTFRGDSWHFMGIPEMTRRYSVAWYAAMRAANLNSVRLHAEPYPSFYLDVADEMGIFVLDETAIWASDGGPKLDDPQFWQDSKQHLSELIIRDRNHPSVFGWSVSNEVRPVVVDVMRNPPGVLDTLNKYYGVWRDVCRTLDPSRSWISSDGEDDGHGALPAYIIHYGDLNALKRGRESGKPWGVGETGNAYYGSPEQVAETNGDRAYESFMGRMEGVAEDSYALLMRQRELGAVYNSVFNMVWYGLKPLPLGLRDTTRPPRLSDGIYFTSFKEGQPGVQPERLGPYTTTLNPGYDSQLPLYQPWPLFYAIRDAATDSLGTMKKWDPVKVQEQAPVSPHPISSINILAGRGSQLKEELTRTGVLFERLKSTGPPAVLMVDGALPPDQTAKKQIDKVLRHGGTVMVWGVAENSLGKLNKLLPSRLTITDRQSSDLLRVNKDRLISGISNGDLYFTSARPATIIHHGLSGPLVDQSKILLTANATDWAKWNEQPEYAKTAMVVRSEREKKPSGVALIVKKIGKGELILTTIPAAPEQQKGEKFVRQILTNIGIPLGTGNDQGKPLLKDGTIARGLYCGYFPVSSKDDWAKQEFISSTNGDSIKAGYQSKNRAWKPVSGKNGILDISNIDPGNQAKGYAATYLSFWISSPRSLDDLLLEPNLPAVNLEVNTTCPVQVYLNEKQIINDDHQGSLDSGKVTARSIKLRSGWNHLLIKLLTNDGNAQFAGKLTSSQPDFLLQLGSTLQKP